MAKDKVEDKMQMIIKYITIFVIAMVIGLILGDWATESGIKAGNYENNGYTYNKTCNGYVELSKTCIEKLGQCLNMTSSILQNYQDPEWMHYANAQEFNCFGMSCSPANSVYIKGIGVCYNQTEGIVCPV